MKKGQGGVGEVYFEFTRLGHQVRVAAIDAASGTEVVIVAPLTITQKRMEEVALAKLRRRLAGEAEPPPRLPGFREA